MYFDEPKCVTVINGAKMFFIEGNIELSQSEIDILQGPEKGNVLHVRQEEECRLNLKSHKTKPRGTHLT